MTVLNSAVSAAAGLGCPSSPRPKRAACPVAQASHMPRSHAPGAALLRFRRAVRRPRAPQHPQPSCPSRRRRNAQERCPTRLLPQAAFSPARAGFFTSPRRSLQSHFFSQSYETILPTSLELVLLFSQSLLNSETCCGFGTDKSQTHYIACHFQGHLHTQPSSAKCRPFPHAFAIL